MSPADSTAEAAGESAWRALVEVIRRLRAPDGCPWDRAQTHRTLRPYVLEEARELVEAITDGAAHALCEELGDLLLQIVLHGVIAEEEGSFTLEDVLVGLTQKLVRRHPHVFGQAPPAATPEEVEQRWRAGKAEEAADSAARLRAERADLLSTVRRGLPALVEAVALSRRAAAVGFDWPDAQACWAQVEEEQGEFRQAWGQADQAQAEEEFGDLLFSLVNVGRFCGLDPEVALARANDKFRRRFTSLQAQAHAEGRALEQLAPVDFDRLWRWVKSQEREKGEKWAEKGRAEGQASRDKASRRE